MTTLKLPLSLFDMGVADQSIINFNFGSQSIYPLHFRSQSLQSIFFQSLLSFQNPSMNLRSMNRRSPPPPPADFSNSHSVAQWTSLILDQIDSLPKSRHDVSSNHRGSQPSVVLEAAVEGWLTLKHQSYG